MYYTKREVLRLGHWPKEFLENLVSEEPSINTPCTIKLKWRCSIHGVYEQYISVHLQGSGCPKCGKSRKRNKDYWESVASLLEDCVDIDKVREGKVKRKDLIRFRCSKHGIYRLDIEHYLAGRRCQKCSKERQRIRIQSMQRERNPFPQWFIDDLEGSPDKEKVLSGELITHDRALFLCRKHGYYKQLIYSHLYGQSCPTCAMHIYRSKVEKQIESYLISIGEKVVSNDRILLDGYECDIYLPDRGIAIEFNGYLFHCSGSKVNGFGGKPKDYHLLKTKKALSKGVKLYHFWEDEDIDFIIEFMKSKFRGEKDSAPLVDKNPYLSLQHVYLFPNFYSVEDVSLENDYVYHRLISKEEVARHFNTGLEELVVNLDKYLSKLEDLGMRPVFNAGYLDFKDYAYNL